MVMSKRIVTRIRINHIARDAEGRATHYQGVVLRGQKAVATTSVMTDGCDCLRAAETLEAQYRAGV